MATSYKHIPAERQVDEFACWAACIKWWKKAKRSVYRSQTLLIRDYNHLTNDAGEMQPAQMKKVLEGEGFKVEEPTSMNFTMAKLRAHLEHSPLVVGYVTDAQTLHVNVIYEIVNEVSGSLERYSQVRVMEPQAFNGGDWRGEHQIKSLGDFTWWGTCMIGSLKPKSN
jgi:hypothetical protein